MPWLERLKPWLLPQLAQRIGEPSTCSARFAADHWRCANMTISKGYTPKPLDCRTGEPPILSHLYTRALLELAFPDLSIIKLREYETEAREGQGPSGLSALIGLVARP
jgi:hypothetical protein